MQARLKPADLLAFANISPKGRRYPCPAGVHDPSSQEKAPDLSLNGDDLWKCFSCGAKGNVFDLAIHLGLATDFAGAVVVCAKVCGVALPKVGASRYKTAAPGGGKISEARIVEIRQHFTRAVRKETGPDCFGYRILGGRCIGRDTLGAAGVGWIQDPHRLAASLVERFGEADCFASGLWSKARAKGNLPRPMFRRHRIVIPATPEGNVLALRSHLDSAKPKELSVGTSAYGVHTLDSPDLAPGGVVLIVEGTIDYLTGAACGVPTLGCPGAEQWRTATTPAILEALAGHPVAVMFDPDTPGRRGGAKLALHLQANDINAIQIEADVDLNDLAASGRLGDGSTLAAFLRSMFVAQPR